MVQPINYLQNVQDPFAQAVQGLQLGTGIANIYAQREADEQKRVQQALAQAEQQRYQTDISTFFTTPPAERKYENLERLFMGANKQQFDALQAVGKTMTEEKLATSKRFTGQVLSALESNLESAKQLLMQRIEAETDPMQKKAWQDTLKLAEVSPDQAIKNVELVGGATFGKDWYESISNVRKSRRDEAAAIPALVKASVDANYAEQNALEDLKKKAADFGLTTAQTNSALATTKKLGVETAKAALELEAFKATGGIDPAKTFEQEEKIRKEWQIRSKVYGELGTTYQNIKSSATAETGPGDIALITGFMKMLDPGSVVRETEFATARDTAGLYTALKNALKKAQNGQFLQESQRNDFTTLAKKYLESAQKKAAEDKKALGIVVKNYKLNPDNVFGPEIAPESESPPAAATRPAAGQRNVTVDY
jgi:hypothetical protein